MTKYQNKKKKKNIAPLQSEGASEYESYHNFQNPRHPGMLTRKFISNNSKQYMQTRVKV